MIRDLLPWRKKEPHAIDVKRSLDPIEELQKQMNELFGNFFNSSGSWLPAEGRDETFMPRFEVTETDEGISVSAELPGVEEKDLEVSVDGSTLTISGEKHSERETKDKGCHFTERSYGSFQRSFALPEGLDLDSVNAKFKNGVLKLFLPRTEESRKNVKKITINQE